MGLPEAIGIPATQDCRGAPGTRSSTPTQGRRCKAVWSPQSQSRAGAVGPLRWSAVGLRTARPWPPRGGAAARVLPRCAWDLESRPRQALGVRLREAAVDDQDRDALRPGFSQVLRHSEGLSSRRCCRPCAHRQHPRRPGGADVLATPIGLRWEHRHALPPQRRLAGALVPLLLPSSIRVEGEDQLAHLSGPVPAPALHAKEGHDTRDASREQRRRIKGALAYLERTGTDVQFLSLRLPLVSGHFVSILRAENPVRRRTSRDHGGSPVLLPCRSGRMSEIDADQGHFVMPFTRKDLISNGFFPRCCIGYDPRGKPVKTCCDAKIG